MATAGTKENLEFQTEARQMLNLVIHSLYSHKEIFLRELISNASDALDKLRFLSLTDASLLPEGSELAIRLAYDKDKKTLTISDNGIGMTRQEIIDNIGTIARSGSKAFLEKLSGDQKADSNLIGQFGVGFYSVFMVAASVQVITKRAGADEPAYCWESSGENSFTIEPADKAAHGTDIVIQLKDDEGSYATEWEIRALIKKYSDYIIYLPDDKGEAQIVNVSKPIWKRSASEISKEQYAEFYKQGCGGFEEPASIIHHRAEGTLEFSALLFVPEKISPFEMYNYERKHGVKLYVKRIFISDDCKELMPEYLRFVKGVVDSEDLPLNVSREILQKNPMIDKIRKALVGKILSKLSELSEKEAETFTKFYQQFGPILKEGLHSDFDNKEKLLEIIRFQSSAGATDADLVTLKDYCARMKEGQKDIYYISAENRTIAEKSPHLEIFREKGIEVLFMVDPIDEFVVPDIGKFGEFELKSITKGDLDLGDLSKDEKKKQKEAEGTFKKLAERLKTALDADVKEVRVTTRLRESPCCLVADENAMDARMEQLMKAMGQSTS